MSGLILIPTRSWFTHAPQPAWAHRAECGEPLARLHIQRDPVVGLLWVKVHPLSRVGPINSSSKYLDNFGRSKRCIGSAADQFSDDPVLKPQASYTVKFAGVVGDQDGVGCQGMGCDHRVKSTNGLALSLERGTKVAVLPND